MTKTNFFEVKAAIGSSRKQVAETVRQGKSFCFCVLSNYTIFVHHDQPHWTLAAAMGAQWEDIIGEGNASDVGRLLGDREPYVVARFKCFPFLAIDQKAVGDAIRNFIGTSSASEAAPNGPS